MLPRRLKPRQTLIGWLRTSKLGSVNCTGGHPLAAALQYGRAVARRAERSLDQLDAESQPLDSVILQYSNRLSDYLFALARYVNYRAGVDEVKSK